jgi:hypothetical protein
MNYALLIADFLLILHICIVMWVVIPVPLILIGKWRNWPIIHSNWFRFSHLGVIAFVVINTWFGNLCPLTLWENDLRIAAGEHGYSQSFIATGLSHVLYYDLPSWVFTLAYTAFGALVVFLVWWIPPNALKKY